MTSVQSANDSIQQDDQDIRTHKRSPHDIFLDRFRLAEDHFCGENAKTDRRKRQRVEPIAEDDNVHLHNDQGSRRTRERAKKIGSYLTLDPEGSGRVRNSKRTRKTLGLEDPIEYIPHTSIFLPPSRQGKSVTQAKKSRMGEFEADEQDNQISERALQLKARNKKEIAEIHAKMPDDSLLEVLQYFSSHFYDKRQELYNFVDDDNVDDTSSTQFGMLQTCEGNALVAIAIYLEEIVKLEAGSRSLTQQSTSFSPPKKAFKRLLELRRKESGAKISQRMWKEKTEL